MMTPTQPQAQPPVAAVPRHNCNSLGGVICISFGTIFGIASIVATAMSWDPYYEYWWEASVAAMSFGAASMILGVISYPLTYKSARRYMDERNSSSPNGFMVTSWIFYAIFILNGAGLLAMGALDYSVATGWVIGAVLAGIAGWVLMFVYQEMARRSPPRPLLPTSIVKCPTSPTTSYPKQPTTFVTIETTVNEDGTRSIKTVRHCVNPDGTTDIEESIESSPCAF